MGRKIFGTSQAGRRLSSMMIRLAPYAAAASAALILWHAARDKPATMVAPATMVHPSSATDAAPSLTRTIPPAPLSTTIATQQAGASIQVVVGRNDTLDAIFRRMSLDKSDLAAIRNLPGIRQSLDFLKPGDAIQVTHTNGEINELSRKVSETQTLKVVREDAGFAAKMISNPVETRIRTANATIDSSVFQAAENAEISDAVALKLANVFAWDIDFVLDIREGDRFTAVYEQIYQDGKYLRDGELLAAEFINGGKVYRAVRFASDGGSASYYTPDGKPMRKAFLRAPVDFTRVSSVFNPNRLHPILNRIRGHMGTDYAAPVGTPIHAAGEGRVSFEGTRGGYGNAVVLSHSNRVSTLYGHMSRFAKNIHVGSHVNQGDIIGFVGMTGLATGPHLHYEYLMNDVHMNPQTVRLPGADPLRADSLTRFRRAADPLLTSLSGPATSPSVTAPSIMGTLPATVAAATSPPLTSPATSPADAAIAAVTNPVANSAPAGVPQISSDSRSKTSLN